MAINRKSDGFRSEFLEEPITHLVYMDDVKVYTSGHEELKQIVGTVEATAQALGMRLGKTKFPSKYNYSRTFIYRNEKVFCGLCREGERE